MKLFENPSSSILVPCFLSGTDYSEFLKRWKQEMQACKSFPSHLSKFHFSFHSRGSETKEREDKKTLDVRLCETFWGPGQVSAVLCLCRASVAPRGWPRLLAGPGSRGQAGWAPAPLPCPVQNSPTQEGNGCKTIWSKGTTYSPHTAEYFRGPVWES